MRKDAGEKSVYRVLNIHKLALHSSGSWGIKRQRGHAPCLKHSPKVIVSSELPVCSHSHSSASLLTSQGTVGSTSLGVTSQGMWELCGLSGPHMTEVTGCDGTRDSGVPLESAALYMSLVLGTHANSSLVQEA